MTTEREAQYDLLTAALLGAAVGAGLAVLAGAGRRRSAGIGGAMLAAVASGRGRAMLGRAAKAAGRGAVQRGMKVARGFGEDAGDHVRHYADSAREAIDDAVAREVRDLRRAVRRRRKRLGI